MANAVTTQSPESHTGTIVIHQLLHGYAEGHRLLGGSVDVPDDLTRLVLRLSDLSGSSITGGFEEYLTGYPLSSLNAYALAKTWYAPEMPRPGCVWTHTLVVSADAMGQMRQLEDLQKLFKRPGEHAPKSSYGKPLLLERGHAPERLVSDQRDMLERVLGIHYGRVEMPVLLASRNSKEFEKLIFALWSQKWPQLRMDFTFCTGSMSARFLGKRPFDVQCVPVPSSRGIMLDLIAAGASEPAIANSAPVDNAPWLDATATDALLNNGGLLRAFLWSVSDSRSARKDFACLVKVFEALQKRRSIRELLSFVGEVFPTPDEGGRLKALLFGERTDNFAFLPAYEERDALLAIGTISEYESFDANAIRLRERSTRLCVESSDTASWLVGELFRSTLNPLGEEILAGIVSSMEPEVARRVTSKQPEFLPALFQAKPSLACASQLWVAGGDRRRELFEAVATHRDLDRSVIKGIIRALLESDSDVLMRRALDLWGRDAIFETLSWMSEQNGAISDSCREALRLHAPVVVEWTELGSILSFPAFHALVRIVAPHASEISNRNSDIWLQTFNRLKSDGNEGDVVYVCGFLLALGFNNAPTTPLDLIGASFERVHEAARTQQLSDRAWFIVEPFVPELSWLSNWDKCERLRRGLVSALVRYRWSALEVKLRIKDHDLLREISRSARKVHGGEHFAE